MFLTARLFLYRQVYFHRTVRAIDLDLAEVFGPSVRAIFGDASPVERSRSTPTSTSTRCSTRRPAGRAGSRSRPTRGPGDGTVTPAVADGWRAILLRRPRWRSEAEVHAEQAAPDGRRSWSGELGEPEPGRVVVDLVVVDARPSAAQADTLAIERRDGGPGPSLEVALARLPAWSLVGRRYRRSD